MSHPTVAVIVLNYNGIDDTVECLESLIRATYSGLRIYVVDNGSRESPRGALSRFGQRLTLIENGSNLGFTGGNNVGTRRALQEGAEYVLLLNNDTVVEPGFVEPMVRAMEEDRTLGMVTPKIYFYGEDRVLWAYGATVGRWTGRSPHIGVYQKDVGQYDHLRTMERITGCAMFVRREVFERVGLLDERFFIYCEELDWCLRTRRAGYGLAVVPTSVIHHKGHRDSGRIGRPFIAYLQTRNQLLMLRNNTWYFACGGGFGVLWHAGSLAREILRNLWGFARSRDQAQLRCAVAFARGAIDFWCGRFGRPPY